MRKFWIELAHPSLRFGCTVLAEDADRALALVRDAIANGDVVIGEVTDQDIAETRRSVAVVTEHVLRLRDERTTS